jgi:putative hemolysin
VTRIGTDDLVRLLAVLGLVFANALFVVAEYALVTSRRSAIQNLAEQGSARARRVLKLMDEPVRVISTVQVGITGLGIGLGAVGEPALRRIFDPVLATGLSVALALIIVTFVSVWLGELVPKAIALHAAERVALIVAAPIDLLGRLFRPVVWLLQVAAGAVLRPLGIPYVQAGERPVTRDELRTVLSEAEETGALGPEEERIIANVFELRAREVREVMTPWDEVDTIGADDPLDATAERVLAARHTRFPAVDEDGEVVGVLHLRDLWRASREAPGARVRAVLRPPVIVPPQTQLPALLPELRRAGQHLAVVVNEYGLMVGVASLEDVLEELVGEIEDEHDRPRTSVRHIGPATWSIDAQLSLAEANRLAGLDLPDERDHTVGGLVFSELGRAPRPGDEVRVGDVVLRVEEVDGHRIERVTSRPARSG